MRRLLYLLLWIAACSVSLYGYSRDLTFSKPFHVNISPIYLQASTVTGKVIDESGVGMPGVNVIVKGTSNGTATDSNGAYTLRLTSDQTSGILVFSFIGYLPQELAIDGRTTINVTLATDLQRLSEVVVVGYGTQEKRDVTSSISSIRERLLQKFRPVTRWMP